MLEADCEWGVEEGWVAPPSASDPRSLLPQLQWGPGDSSGWTCLTGDLGQVTAPP